MPKLTKMFSMERSCQDSKSFQSTVRLSTLVTVPEFIGWTHDYSDSVRPSGDRPLSELSRPVAPTPAFTSDCPTHNMLSESSGSVAPTVAVVLSDFSHAVRIKRVRSHSSSIVAVLPEFDYAVRVVPSS